MAQRQRSKTSGRGTEELELEAVDSDEYDEGEVEELDGGARRGLRELLEERPLLVGTVSLAAGLLAGLVVPGTRREDELLGSTRDRLLDQARQRSRDAIDRGKEVAQGAVAVATEGFAPAAPARKPRTARRPPQVRAAD